MRILMQTPLRFLAVLMLASLAGAQESPVVLEAHSKAESGDDAAWRTLVDGYAAAGNVEAYIQEVLWLIDHQPGSKNLIPTIGMSPHGGFVISPADYDRVKEAWEVQLGQHPDSASVLANAALFLKSSDPVRSTDLLEQARNIAFGSGSYEKWEAQIYATAFTHDREGKPFRPLTQENADLLKTRLLDLSDPALLSSTGTILAGSRDPETKQTGFRLLEQAVSVDPSNPRWQTSLDLAENGGPATDAVRIGGAVAEANLVRKVDAIYPSLAKSARVSGSVEFTVIINKEGDVENLQLLRGHPLLVNAAKEAVLQWKYKPTLLNGNPVKVTTPVIINFTLSQ